MEKSTNAPVEPGQSLNAAETLATAGGLSLFWACLFSMLVRNAFPDGGAAGAMGAARWRGGRRRCTSWA